jgi:hypothetical protein
MGKSIGGALVHSEVKGWLDEFEFHEPISSIRHLNQVYASIKRYLSDSGHYLLAGLN